MNSWVAFANNNKESCTLSYSIDGGATYQEETLAYNEKKTVSLHTVYASVFAQAYFRNAAGEKSEVSSETISPSAMKRFITAELSYSGLIRPGSSLSFAYSADLDVWNSKEALAYFTSDKIFYRYAIVLPDRNPTAKDWQVGSLTGMSSDGDTRLHLAGHWSLTCPDFPGGAISESQNSLVGALKIDILDIVTSGVKESGWYRATTFTAYPITDLSSANFYAGGLSFQAPASKVYHTNDNMDYSLPSYENTPAALFYRDVYAPRNYGACEFWSGYNWYTKTIVPELSNEVETTTFWTLDTANNRYKRTFFCDNDSTYSPGHANDLLVAGALRMKGSSTSFSTRNFATTVPAKIPNLQTRLMDNSTETAWFKKTTTIAVPLYNPGAAALSLSYQVFVKGTSGAVKSETLALPAKGQIKMSYQYGGDKDTTKRFCFVFDFTTDITGTGDSDFTFLSKRYLMACNGDAYLIKTVRIQERGDSYPVY
jgi:hypothetical protein